jgi:GrpB-like predicted nucleotidyltransferase (UPF0157 family)
VLHPKLNDVPEIDEPVHLSPYDRQWPTLFAAEAARVSSSLPVPAAIEHIGSTSVPGLLAKPIIDIMVGIESENWDDARRSLALLGYEDLGEAGVPGRLYFRRRAENAFNIHVVLREGPIWKDNLALRDHLRQDSEAARTYAQTKRSAIESGATMLLSYSAYKREILTRLLAAARPRDQR